MSVAASIPLTVNQRATLEAFLQEVPSHIATRAIGLMRERALRSVQATPLGLVAQVQGDRLFKVTLRFTDIGLDLACSCDSGPRCAHTVTLMMELRKHAPTLTPAAPKPVPRSTSSPTADRARPTTASTPRPHSPARTADGAAGSLHGSIPSPDGESTATSAPARTLGSAPSAPAAAHSLIGQVTALLGQPLTPAARTALLTVEPWWVNRVPKIEQATLLQACGRTAWGYQKITLWPTGLPPESVAEFLTCLTLALKKHGAQLPDPLPTLVTPALEKQLTARWQQQQAVQEWKTLLGQWQEVELEEDLPEPGPELRLLLHRAGASIQARQPDEADYGKISLKALRELCQTPQTRIGQGSSSADSTPRLSPGSALVLKAFQDPYGKLTGPEIPPLSEALNRCLTHLAKNPDLLREHVATPDGGPLQHVEEPLTWQLTGPHAATGHYHLHLRTAAGTVPDAPVALLPGSPTRYLTAQAIYPLAYWPFKNERPTWPVTIPAAALESREGVNALAKLGVALPPTLAPRVQRVQAHIQLQAQVHRPSTSAGDHLRLQALASFDQAEIPCTWNGRRWVPHYRSAAHAPDAPTPEAETLIQVDKSALPPAAAWLRQMPLRPSTDAPGHVEQKLTGRDWPETVAAWLTRRPPGLTVQLDAELASLRDGHLDGHLRLDLEEASTGLDWFDLTVALDVGDHTLTPEELDLLLRAQGKWVKLPTQGWRRLDLHLTSAQEADLATLGLSARDFTGQPQRLHALQLQALAHAPTALLPPEATTRIQRRLEDLHTRVTPAQPATIQATLRPYQTQGFHFLAYLASNHFGGVLADDMGLGKTLQALTWIAWLRAEQKVSHPILVICPKSVQDNWRAEAQRFYPDLRVTVWDRRSAGKTGLDDATDLLVIHYAQLRQHEAALTTRPWGAAILDEAQAIKNPTSQSARAACALQAQHRLALTGTPIENRLLDLWSIFTFAMPGILGNRASFTRHFDASEDPLARRRLAARTRPFLLRRTKKEVAPDLPDRIEEDLLIEMEGPQARLYQAELKRARAQLLKVETTRQLDQARFSVLTSLLRLRQICCHPRLIGLTPEGDPAPRPNRKSSKKAIAAAPSDTDPAAEPAAEPAEPESAKLQALLEQLEPIVEEGQKALVFSQFVQMLHLIQEQTEAQGWTTFILTGDTEDRGALVAAFQAHEGPAVFLISLKAGGSGLNLTAASYVILYDPWWNPAVEAQAIDRTHRIGQQQTVFAYRLLMKGSLEEKIRLLQQQKGALAQDLLGEETFAQALTLQDFHFLLSDA